MLREMVNAEKYGSNTTAPAIYVVRHGQTKDFEKGIINTPGTPLSPEGKRQACRAATQLSRLGIVPGLIVCSTMPRSLQTAQIIRGKLGLPKALLLVESLFDERNGGDSTGMPIDFVKNVWPKTPDKPIPDVPHAETLEQLTDRAGGARGWLNSRPESPILIVGHSIFTRVLAQQFAGKGQDPPSEPYLYGQHFAHGQIMSLQPVVEILPLPGQVPVDVP